MKYVFAVLFALALFLLFTPQFALAEEPTPPLQILDLPEQIQYFDGHFSMELRCDNTAAAEKNWSVIGGALPPYLELDSASGKLEGNLTQGVYTFTIKLETDIGDAVREFTITIYEKTVKVTFVVENGTFSEGNTKITKTLYLINGAATLTADEIPSDMAPTPPFAFGQWDAEPPTAFGAITKKATYTYRFYLAAAVRFKVINGNWADGTDEDIVLTVPLIDGEGRLNPDDIPSAVAAAGFCGGAWDADPYSSGSAITCDKIYSYAFKEEPRQETSKVTFSVVNGTWADGTSGDITQSVVLTDGKGTLKPEQIPQNMRPNDGFYNGAWLASPSTEENAVEGEITYTYVFERKPSATAPTSYPKAKITFRVVNGVWPSGGTEITVYVTLIGGKGFLNQEDIPAALANPGFCEGSWDSDPFSSYITCDKTYTYAFKKEELTQTSKITFLVINGRWKDGSDEIALELPVVGGKAVLDPSLIPSAVPNEGYLNGSWNTDPALHANSAESIAYIFTYEKAPNPETEEDAASEETKILLISTGSSLLGLTAIAALYYFPRLKKRR